jgi:hypothetical protein
MLITIRYMSSLLLLLTATISIRSSLALAGDSPEPSELRHFHQEIQRLKSDEALERDRVERDEKAIRDLENRLGELEAQNRKLGSAAQALQISNTKSQAETKTTKQLQELQNQVAVADSSGAFSSAMSRYLGTHQFTFAGSAAFDFIYDRKTSINTFSLEFEPIALYGLNDWILFEGTINALLSVGSKPDFELPVAAAQIFPNDYLELNAGIFDQPFGDWLEDQSPFWVNRFITAAL